MTGPKFNINDSPNAIIAEGRSSWERSNPAFTKGSAKSLTVSPQWLGTHCRVTLQSSSVRGLDTSYN